MIYAASRNNNYEVIDVLVSYGGNVNIPNDLGYTPLIRCVKQGHIATIKMLLKHQADPFLRTDDSDLTAREYAERDRNEEIVNMLTFYEEDYDRLCSLKDDTFPISIKTENQEYSFYVALKKGNISKISSWLYSGQFSSAHQFSYALNRTPLHIACLFDQPELTRFLIKEGVDLNIFDDHGSSPLILAVSVGSINCLIRLIEGGVDVTNEDLQTRVREYCKTYLFSSHCQLISHYCAGPN